ncbi:hypothetical protein PGB90_004207 [Kerria lacca]
MDFINDDVLSNILKKINGEENVKLLGWRNTNKYGKEIAHATAYTSDQRILIVEYENETGKHQKSFFVKRPMDVTQKHLERYKLHEKEVYAYKAILSEFEKFIDYRIIPKYYYSDNKNNLVLEDLCAEGYRTYKQHEFLDFEHSVKVMQVLATYHALTHKLITVSTQLFDHDAAKDYTHKIYNEDKNFHTLCREGILKILNRVDSSFVKKYGDKLNVFLDNVTQNSANEIKPKSDSFKVFAHGDFRSGNLMFKYDKYQKLEDIKIIDHQTGYISDPSIDILNYFTQSVEFEIFEKYFYLLLEIYVNSLNRLLNYLRCDQIYTIEELRNDMSNKYNTIICHTILHLPLALSDPDDVDKDLLQNDKSSLDNKHFQKLSEKWFKYFIKNSVNIPTFGIFF